MIFTVSFLHCYFYVVPQHGILVNTSGFLKEKYKMTIMSSFTQFPLVPNLYEFMSFLYEFLSTVDILNNIGNQKVDSSLLCSTEQLEGE